MATSNNLGVNAGTAEASYFGGSDSSIQGVIFTPDPHTVSVQDPSQPWWSPPTTETSPGHLWAFGNLSVSNYGNFYGTVAGINDHSNLLLNEFTWPRSAGGYAVVVPQLQVGNADTVLGTFGGVNSVAYALNNSNHVVGWSQIASGAQHAFLYSNGTMLDLNQLIPSSAGITLSSAVGIDAAGEIVAFGTDASGQSNEYFLSPLESPVPEPSTLAIMGLMIVAVAARQAYSRRRAYGAL